MLLGLLSVVLVGGLVVRCLSRYRSMPARLVAVLSALVLLVPFNMVAVAERGVLGATAVLAVGLGAMALAGVWLVAAERLRER